MIIGIYLCLENVYKRLAYGEGRDRFHHLRGLFATVRKISALRRTMRWALLKHAHRKEAASWMCHIGSDKGPLLLHLKHQSSTIYREK
jgi:hypothetical protein